MAGRLIFNLASWSISHGDVRILFTKIGRTIPGRVLS
jgi:hypothetical protein